MKATLFVSFGTTHQDAYQAAISPLVQAIAEKTNGVVYEAITSRFVKRKLLERGVMIDSLEEALEKMKRDGVTQALVVSNFVMPAFEYERMIRLVEAYDFEARFTPALLSRFEDQVKLVKIMEELHAEAGKALYLLGHGSEHPSGAILSQLQLIADDLGLNHIYHRIAGFPGEAAAMKRLQPDMPVVLVPLLYVAGDHGRNDTLKLAETLRQKGHLVKRVVVGLGEQPAIRELTLQYV